MSSPSNVKGRKRTSHVIDLTLDSDSDGTPTKRPRSILDHFRRSPSFESHVHVSSTPPPAKRTKSLPTTPRQVVQTRSKKTEEIGPSGQSYTPLELQVRQLKQSNPGTLIIIEVGYKYRFFGDDARVASRELGIACYPKRNFLTASIPTHRLQVHLKKLLSQGHRVGVVNQTETAALKKIGENRSGPFDRQLTYLYTAATYVDELNSVDDLERYSPPPLMCLIEEPQGGMGVDERVAIGMIVVSPSTGDVIWDEFHDTHMRTELETRMIHIKPAELLLPRSGLSKLTERMLVHFSKNSAGGTNIRIERFGGQMSYTDAFSLVSEYYTDKTKHNAASENFKSGKLMATIVGFPQRVVIVLAHAIKHLSEFSIADAFMEANFFSRFTTKAHMLLNGNTVTNLEIFRNETDFGVKGSLMWVLDRTKTKFGARLLKDWVGKPLVDKEYILQARIDAVEEIISSSSEKLVSLREALKNLPDLAKGLCRIQYGKCTPQELAILLRAFDKLGNAFEAFENISQVGLGSPILNDIIASLPKLKEPIQRLMSDIHLKRAAEGDKVKLWTDPNKYPDINDVEMAIGMIKVELEDELKSIRKTLKRPSIQWTTVAGEEYLIEVKKSENVLVPDTWLRVSATKYLERFHTPNVKEKIQELAQYKESLELAAHVAFKSFLKEICSHYDILRSAVNNLATADCLLSLALVALQDGYVKPEFTQDGTLEIVDGRHPMIEALRSDPFVPNTVRMGNGAPRSKIITGPNMGGKSSCVRMIALVAIMAQIGSFVPAASVRLGMLDSILTRMGASDEIARGRSTFMVEMSETSDILRSASRNSLVILDELGRGTSTVDGMAVAAAVLHHLLEVTKCKTLFITHYPVVATELEKKFPSEVQNLHVGYTAETRIDGKREIAFLYRLAPGAAAESFGIECARLAGIPESILEGAREQSTAMGVQVEQRLRKKRAEKCARLLCHCLKNSRQPWEILEELDALLEGTNLGENST